MPNKKANTVARFAGPRLVPFAGIGAEVFSELVGHADKSVGIGRCRLLPRYVGPNFRILAVEVEPLFESRLRIRLDRINRAFRLANTTIDAFVRVDDEHVLTLVEAVYRTHLDTVSVLAADTALVDDVGHIEVYNKVTTRRSPAEFKGKVDVSRSLIMSLQVGADAGVARRSHRACQ